MSYNFLIDKHRACSQSGLHPKWRHCSCQQRVIEMFHVNCVNGVDKSVCQAILKEVICEYKNERYCNLLVIRFVNRCHASVFVSASDVFYLIVQTGQKLPSFLTMASQCFTAWREFAPTWSLPAYWSLSTSRLFCTAGLWQVVQHFQTSVLHVLCSVAQYFENSLTYSQYMLNCDRAILMSSNALF
jgi:hypothetical protein